ncbi:hypothetical protein LZF95_12875 [Algoriphagus sp. AGSA1]|uniref:hypothetical protein n=1 Tax=Algoriphagus sp. AGSA1 TaxID=2907213 RepID=UPI001F3FFD2D|nr:hypothetical protein [Algoriphagus sp. AGSA1]MCE7055574.1 hypothetical protein [Algoriphagus sp. AGSA1]
MNLKVVDFLVLIFCNLPLVYFLVWLRKSKGIDQGEQILVTLLWLVHLGFSFFYASYILHNGGDSLRFWQLTADTSQHAQNWMGYFGINTFFIQWLNYIPSKLLGFSYWSGTFVYSTFSFMGVVLLFLSFRFLILERIGMLAFPKLLYLPLFLPGLHFWTAGVSKENLLFLGLSMLFYSLTMPGTTMILGLIGWIICLFVRPVVGIFFIPVLVWLLLPVLKKSLSKSVILIVILVILFFQAINQFLLYLHLESFSQDSFKAFSTNQLYYLNSFNASTAIPMVEMNSMERLFAVIFRPLLWESWDFYSVIIAIENTWLMLITLLALFLYSYRVYRVLIIYFSKFSPARRRGGMGGTRLQIIPWYVVLRNTPFPIPFSAKYYSIIAVGMFLLFTFTLNNFGLFYRMKSIWMPFLQFSILWLICSSTAYLKRSP